MREQNTAAWSQRRIEASRAFEALKRALGARKTAERDESPEAAERREKLLSAFRDQSRGRNRTRAPRDRSRGDDDRER